ncbi:MULTISPECIES: NUDIX hydrolase [Streptomyces]|uniref:NUDIX domain-containing protein n=1 Tax=Streptomyces morookaense TaxID=1970 RepID=A0A7Y7E8I6_STRMO|nr:MULTISPECIES: NUDIX hydrolase [Streptomyces]MCC2276083.1 NUDIX domain-containing protein [Streptomyces sp. ET3-23]NVK79469.1 NUDIX domain-containing protein [Streptomyces morookaense]GHF04282.1 ATP/GTP-binding protein [Streptomyces morookaense]
MIVWLNGAFGAGKTSTARRLTELIPGSTLYDPEVTGGALRHLLPAPRMAGVTDYQDLPVWRRMVVDTAAALLAELGGVLVVPMTLLRQEYRDEIFGGLASRRIPVRHVLLAPEETILRSRIEGRVEFAHDPVRSEAVRQWAREHLAPYGEALETWLKDDAFAVDNSRLTPQETAERVAEAVRSGAAGPCEIVQTPEPTAETLAAGVLLFDEDDRVLLVDPTYKPGWEFPGGVVEPGEPPARAGMREVAEEIGIELPAVPRLLVVDWEPPTPPGYGGLRFLFDGGRLTGADARRLLLPGSELRGWRFVTEDEATSMLPPVRLSRLRWALRARERGRALNLEAGVPVG